MDITQAINSVRIIQGDALATLRKLPSDSVDCVVTSPPYWGLRDYKAQGQMGLEDTPQHYIKRMVQVFRQVRRVLKKEGTCWLNIGDSYIGNGAAYGNAKSTLHGTKHSEAGGARRKEKRGPGLKAKDLALIPARLAIALQADGWYVRNDIIWHKPNGMPSSVRDRFTQNHEYLFLLTKSARYFFDQEAVKEPVESAPDALRNKWDRDQQTPPGQKPQKRPGRSGNKAREYVNHGNPGMGSNIPWEGFTRNKRTVWEVATANYGGEHFAVFPPKLIEPCILAGCPVGGTVLDPFGGSGTTAGVAVSHGRRAIHIDLNPDHNRLVPDRVEQVMRALLDAPAPPPAHYAQTSLLDFIDSPLTTPHFPLTTTP